MKELARSSDFRVVLKGFLLTLMCLLTILYDHSLAHAQSFDQQGIVKLRFPDSGAIIGQGVNLATGLSASNVCINGTATTMNPSGPTPQVITVSIRDNKDAYSFFRSTAITASAQAKFLIGSADATTKYVSSHQFLSNVSNFSVHATVEQRQYIVPEKVRPNDSTGPADTSVSRGVQLTKDALSVLKSDPKKFRLQCGDGFIAVLIQGAEIIGTVSVLERNQSDSMNLQTSMNADLFGSGASGSLDETLKRITNGRSFKLDYLQTGGSGDPVATDQEHLITAVQGLAKSAQSAPYTFQVIVRDYKTLPNWPTDTSPFSTPTMLDRLLSTYWRLDALLQQATDAQLPHIGAPMRYMEGFNWTPESLRALTDSIKSRRSETAKQAIECFNTQTCNPPTTTAIDMYGLAIQLPLPWIPQTPNAADFWSRSNAFGATIQNFNTRKAQLADALSQAFKLGDKDVDPTCYHRNHALTQSFETTGYPKNISDPINNFSNYLPNLPALLRDDAVDYYARQPTLRRCQESATDVDCELKEADFSKIATFIKLRGLKLITNFDPVHSHEYGECKGGGAGKTAYIWWILQ